MRSLPCHCSNSDSSGSCSAAQPVAPSPAAPQDGLAKVTNGDAKKLVVLVTSDAPGGVKWCGDCSAADPVIERVLEEHEEPVIMVRAFCQRNHYSLKVDPNNANYFYRKHPQMHITAIPTLFRWSSEGAGNKLVEADCAKESMIKLILEDED